MRILRAVACLVCLALVAFVGQAQFPPGTPGVTRCSLMSTNHARTADDIKLSSSSYIVKIGPQNVVLHLEFAAFQAKGLLPGNAIVAVVPRLGGAGVAARPRLVATDRYVADLSLIGLPEPYHVLVSFKATAAWWEFKPINCR